MSTGWHAKSGCSALVESKVYHFIRVAGARRYTRSLLATFRHPLFLRLASVYSVRPPARCHIAGDLGIGWMNALLQNLAMICVYAVKLVFEYYVLTRPMVRPVRALLDSVCWPCISSLPDFKLNWLLVVMRFSPAIVLCQARHCKTTLQNNAANCARVVHHPQLRFARTDCRSMACWCTICS